MVLIRLTNVWRCANSLLGCCVTLKRGVAWIIVSQLCLALPVYSQDYRTYHTVQNSHLFEINWLEFYESAEARSLEIKELVRHKSSIAYGEDPKQRLDVYFPDTDGDRFPVLIFLHGGGNIEGDRRQYGFVARPFVRNDIVVVVPSYRLQPHHPWPAQKEDAEAIVVWTYNNIKELGGDPDRIYLSGHSAGSRLTKILAYRSDWRSERQLPEDILKGVVLVSGVSTANPSREEIPDEFLRYEASLEARIESPPPLSIIAVGELEFHSGGEGKRLHNSRILADMVRDSGGQVEFLELDGLDHATIVNSLEDDSSSLFGAALRMINY